jgi:hypothetical protein
METKHLTKPKERKKEKRRRRRRRRRRQLTCSKRVNLF